MILTRSNNNKGNALIVVILIMVVLFIGGLFLSIHSSGQARNTQRALGGDQAASLAEAGLNRAMRLLSEDINKSDAFEPTAPKDSVAVAIKYPLPEKSSSERKLSGEIGNDKELDVDTMESDGLKKVFTYTKADLIKDDDIIKDLVDYAGYNKVKDWDINVEVELESAYKICSKNESGEEYEVPGVDIPFETMPTVKEFLNNSKSIPDITLRFPSDMKLLDFSIPFSIWIPILNKQITIAKIDPVSILDIPIKSLTKGTDFADFFNKKSSGVGINDMVTLDTCATVLFDKLLKWDDIYPLKLSFDKNKKVGEDGYFTKKENLWPSGINVPSDMSRTIEKYGTMKFQSIAEITFMDDTKSTRRITATKDFKVSDICPMAPMYSMFIANTGNNRINFNDNGGQLYVQNNANKVVKKMQERFDNKDNDGLIRVNFLPKDAKNGGSTENPLVVNVSLVGGMDGPRFAENNIADAALNIAAGADAPLMLNAKSQMSVVSGKYNLDWTVYSDTQKVKKDGKMVPQRAKLKYQEFNSGFSLDNKIGVKRLSSKPDYLKNRSKYMDDAAKGKGLGGYNEKRKLYNLDEFRLPKFDNAIDKLAGWKKDQKLLNFIPDLDKTSSNIFGYATTMIKRVGNGSAWGGLCWGSAASGNNWLNFELPAMGTNNSEFCLPNFGTGENKTHLFGATALSPTLTREIEGAVGKKWKQWNTTVVGLLAKDRLPLLPLSPPFCNVPLCPIPWWWANTKISKYDYNLMFLKAYDSDKDDVATKFTCYDPSIMENMPANWYSNEQYAKKSNYFYTEYADFLDDLENRKCKIDGEDTFILNGVTYISGSLGTDKQPFNGFSETPGTFNVTGKGMIVCSGNAVLDCNIKYKNSEGNQTVFSLICRNGGIVIPNKGEYVLQGSYYSNKGLYTGRNTKLDIQGNWVTNEFQRARMLGDTIINYVAHYVRPSLGSLHPEYGKYDPRRYNVVMDSKWGAWKVDSL